jgi:hypothetical protein
MSRNISPALLASTLTEPTYLVELGFDPPLYFTNGKTETWNEHTWEEAPLSISALSVEAAGSLSLTVTVLNHDLTFGALVLGQGTKDRTARVWLAPTDPGVEPPIMMADGFMDGASIGSRVSINVIGRTMYYGSSPRMLCGPPIFNHLPADGTVLTWGNVTYTLGSRR